MREQDYAPARLFLELAAQAGHPQAMFALAEIFDPTTPAGSSGARPDLGRARELYAVAASRGVPGAAERLRRLQGAEGSP
jgi:TPR repeat protein